MYVQSESLERLIILISFLRNVSAVLNVSRSNECQQVLLIKLTSLHSTTQLDNGLVVIKLFSSKLSRACDKFNFVEGIIKNLNELPTDTSVTNNLNAC